MTVEEIIQRATLLKRMPINDARYAIMWINDAMDILSTTYDTACLADGIDPEKITAIAYKEYALNTQAKGIRKVTWSDTGYEYRGFAAHNGFIKFQDDGTFTIYFYRAPSVIPLNADITLTSPEVPADYHGILPLFVAARELVEVDQTSILARERMAEFYTRAEQVHKRLESMSKDNNVMPARVWR